MCLSSEPSFRSSVTSLLIASRCVSPCSRRLPASRSSWLLRRFGLHPILLNENRLQPLLVPGRAP